MQLAALRTVRAGGGAGGSGQELAGGDEELPGLAVGAALPEDYVSGLFDEYRWAQSSPLRYFSWRADELR